VRFLVDTNVVSENRRGERANPGVRKWFAAVDSEDLALSVLVLGELRLGVLRLERRDPAAAAHLSSWLTRLEWAYRGRLVPVDSAVTEAWAELNVSRPLPVIDSLQAATAMVHGLTLVTRNVDDLEGVDVPLLNPFSG
jgi:hypothetical protein